MGLPVYFISDIPPEAVISVSIGIFWALVVAVLLLTARAPGREMSRIGPQTKLHTRSLRGRSSCAGGV